MRTQDLARLAAVRWILPATLPEGLPDPGSAAGSCLPPQGHRKAQAPMTEEYLYRLGGFLFVLVAMVRLALEYFR